MFILSSLSVLVFLMMKKVELEEVRVYFGECEIIFIILDDINLKF